MLRLLLAIASLSVVVSAEEPEAEPLHLHVISGSKEYKSEASLKAFLPKFTQTTGAKVTASWGSDGVKHLDGLEQIAECDVLLVFARRMKLPEEEMQLIRAHWEAGKPVVGLRTASHAFQKEDNEHFDKTVMGGNYAGHFGGQPVTVSSIKGVKHPILSGVGQWTSTKLYKSGELAENAVVLQTGAIEDGKSVQPVTWVHSYKGGHMVMSSLGTPQDFARKDFQRLLTNAILWAAERNP